MKMRIVVFAIGLSACGFCAQAGGQAETRHVYENELARTPPMGWNSWNRFAKEINEDLIKEIADAMVASGMRDAGYEFLVLDDAWLAPERDENGRLWGDPDRFPGGMKALGDYIHGKGLKYGIYQDRGHSTCQQLPGSFEHEAVDMATFAEWGVDYLKLDSCFAENNGRRTTDDYRIYKEAIIKAGRPIVLSMSDFGNGGWAWGGKDIGHLWRTSGDIRSNMGSVYNCAETSAGDSRSHPAFNGLWQFAGLGHWNDPDMLQVGNLPEAIQDRAHFSLWCILAAPLMAGNDLRSMTDVVRDTLTAPEVIAVNQDPRAIQGYKVHIDGPLEVYNKPLHDGATAVLLLNKGARAADITVDWKSIGLSGRQPVRDLWARKDLGSFKDSFTASDLPQHGTMLIKVGKPGSKLVPVAEPLAEEKYTVTRNGDTYLSDLCYIWKKGGAPPKSDTNIEDGKIVIQGTEYAKGLGFKTNNAVIYKLNRRANRFQAIVGFDDAHTGEGGGRFRLLNEDWFGRDVLFDSGKMAAGAPPQTIDVDIRHVDCLYLEFMSDKGRRERSDALGNWANARVISTGR